MNGETIKVIMDSIFDAIGKVIFYIALMGLGILFWTCGERFGYVPAACYLDSGAYDVLTAEQEMKR